jgi:hypothetical protein
MRLPGMNSRVLSSSISTSSRFLPYQCSRKPAEVKQLGRKTTCSVSTYTSWWGA